ncbi:MAG: alpha-ketoglutarate-dependent dioxygenase AlkB [Alcanivoracaceae bacterium]|nr:alpha-ketoglutarate-dependent dioxygenase AlkB [Alcanivoracaceae bacterium]
MDLFEGTIDQPRNLLHRDGTVQYYGPQLSFAEANHYYASLLEKVKWQNDQAIIMGKRVFTKRKIAWYGEKPFAYSYSHTTKIALPWIVELLELKAIVEDKTGHTFNSCLLNLYHNGSEGMAWHSDAEKDLEKNGAIASLSFGAERKFAFKHKQSKETVALILQHASLLVMKDETQSHWLHRLPPTTKINKPRINLTFRTINTN